MTSLHDELSQLTATQPAQPGDRLSGVTGKARRIRRNRAAASALSVLAVVGIGAAVALVPGGRTTSSGQLAAGPGTPVTQWADRSERAAKPYSDGAVYGWNPDAVHHVTWVYRGLHHGNNSAEATDLVMVFRGEQQGLPYLVTATIDRTKVNSNGHALFPTADNWAYTVTPITAGGPRSVALAYPSGGDSDVFVIEAPSARTLTWRVTPLPHAQEATTDTRYTDETGTSRSSRGVFGFHVGKVLGRLTYDVSGGGRTVTDVALPENAGVLADADSPPINGTLHVGSAGALEASGGRYATTMGTPESLAGSQVAIRCYGGGTLTVEAKGRAGAVPCDGAAYQGVLQAGRSSVVDDLYVQLSSDRLVGYNVIVYTPAS